MKKRIKTVAVFWIFVTGCFGLSGCDNKLMTNTVAYREAHGIKEGKDSELRIKEILFRFPAHYPIEPYTDGKIVRGAADSVRVRLDYSKWLDPVPNIRTERNALVEVEIRNTGYEDDKKISDYLANKKWISVTLRPDLQLREWIEELPRGGVDSLRVYENVDESLRTPRGGNIVFTCLDRVVCRAYYQHPLGPLIQYSIPSALFSHWREINTDVVRLVDSWVLK